MYAVVQVRGVVNTRKEIKDTLKMLRLHHINHCVIAPDTPQMVGMIRKVKDFVAWGEITPETLETLMRTRGRLEGNDPLTDDYVREHTGTPVSPSWPGRSSGERRISATSRASSPSSGSTPLGRGISP